MKLSVIVCTHNRAAYLPLVLASLDRQLLSREEFEVLLVDNASTDSTVETVSPWVKADRVRYLYEQEIGLSRARNRGWQEARGELIAYLDDDAVASPEWGQALLEAAGQLGEKMGVLGGRVELIWPESIPQWLPQELHRYLGALDWGDGLRWLSPSEWIVGTNCAFRRSAFAASGGFSNDLGRSGKCLLSNEESFMRHQLARAGYLCGYSSNALVYHHVDPSRLNHRWFQRRIYWQGISSAQMLILLEEMTISRRIYHILFTILRVLKNLAVWLLSTIRGKRIVFHQSCRLALSLGMLKGFTYRKEQ